MNYYFGPNDEQFNALRFAIFGQLPGQQPTPSYSQARHSFDYRMGTFQDPRHLCFNQPHNAPPTFPPLLPPVSTYYPMPGFPHDVPLRPLGITAPPTSVLPTAPGYDPSTALTSIAHTHWQRANALPHYPVPHRPVPHHQVPHGPVPHGPVQHGSVPPDPVPHHSAPPARNVPDDTASMCNEPTRDLDEAMEELPAVYFLNIPPDSC